MDSFLHVTCNTMSNKTAAGSRRSARARGRAPPHRAARATGPRLTAPRPPHRSRGHRIVGNPAEKKDSGVREHSSSMAVRKASLRWHSRPRCASGQRWKLVSDPGAASGRVRFTKDNPRRAINLKSSCLTHFVDFSHVVLRKNVQKGPRRWNNKKGKSKWRTAKRPELRKRNGGEQEREASEAAESPGSAESESCGGGEPNDWSCGRRGEERRGEKHLKCPSLPAAPRVRAAWPAPCSSFLAASAEQRVAPGGDGRTVPRWSNGHSCGKECRGVGGAEGASGAPSPGAERLPGLAGWGTAKRPELRKRNGGEQDREASEAAESPGSAESESCGAGEPNDWSCGRRREERRGEKHLKCQSLPAAPRVRAAWPAPCSSFLAASAEQRVAPGGDGRTVRRWINGHSCGKECRGVGGAEGASGAPSPGAERLPGLAGCVTE
ncbi:uncharacterized protein LOC142365717 [Opisthocomus hoazin]|uniref:uncharacterized protein LOC142365717 n=1 Tax=Opisthocomus hoazin TaxID=30419 RepID=UPI003F531442